MEKVRIIVNRYWKILLVGCITALIADMIGTLNINIGIGNLVIYPMVIATVIGGLLGPDLLKVFKKSECIDSGALVLVVIAPFMARMGVMAGASLAKLVAVSPALILQELGNLGTIVFSLPVALLLGLKREAIGATYSVNRDGNLALSNDIWGPDSPETYGTFSVYIVGSAIGAIIMSILVSLIAGLNWFHPLALGMASGVGSGSMMAAAVGTLCELYPAYAEDIVLYAGVSDTLSGIDGVYIGTFIAIPLTTWLYEKLEPKLGRFKKSASVEVNKEGDEK